MMYTRSNIVKTAQSFLGVPWRHQGRSRITGVDCVGLVYAIADEMGMLPKGGLVIPPYRVMPDARLLDTFSKYMTPISPRAMQNGTVLIFSFGGSPHHAGIVQDVNSSALIHAYAAKHKVVIDMINGKQKGRRILRAFDYKGVQDG